MLIDQGHLNEFIRNPEQHKKEWDALQALHPKAAITTFPVSGSMSLADTEAFSELMLDIYFMGQQIIYHTSRLKIHTLHAQKLEVYLAAGGKKEDFKCRLYFHCRCCQPADLHLHVTG